MSSQKTPRYGWVIVVVASFVMLATLPGRTHGLGLITEPLLKDLKIDRVAFANINLWATLLGALFCLPVGWAIDRLGLRVVTAVLLMATALSTWAVSTQSGAFLPLLCAVVLSRGFGQSALSVCSITAVGKWFTGRPGVAMGVFAFLMSFLIAAAFGVIGWAIKEHGWRSAWTGVALLVFAIAPIALMFLKNPPAAPLEEEVSGGLSLNAALRTRAFWIFAGASALFSLASSGLGLFQESVLAERGFGAETYYTLMVVTTLISLIAQLSGGWLALRLGMGALSALSMLIYAVALAMLPFVNSAALLWTFAALMGVASGFVIVVFFAVWSQYFGRAHLGRIQAAAQMITVLASASGPLLFAKCQAATGSYSPILFTLSPVVLVFGLAAWRTRPPLAE